MYVRMILIICVLLSFVSPLEIASARPVSEANLNPKP